MTNNDRSLRSKSHSEKYFIILLVFVVTLIVTLIYKGYPAPYNDDLAQVGAALSLSRGDGYANPYVREWMAVFPTEKPFFYPPGMTYLLAGWLSVFGTSVQSMLSYQWLFILSGAASIIFFLRRWSNQSLPISLVGGLAFLLAFQLEGFRNEVPAYALAFIGISLCFQQLRIIKYTGYFFLAFAGVIYPVVPLVVAPAYFAVYLTLDSAWPWHSIHRFKPLLAEIPYVFAGASTAFVLFLWMIGGELDEFLRVIRIHKNMAIPGGLMDNLKGFWYINTAFNQKLIRLPLVIASGLAVVWSIVSSIRTKNTSCVVPLSLTICCLLSILTNPMRAKTIVPVFEIIVVMIVLASFLKRRNIIPAFTGLLFVCLINLKILLELIVQTPVDQEIIREIRSELKHTDYNKSKVLIGPWTARYVYSYNIPPTVIDLPTWGVAQKHKGPGLSRFLNPSTKQANELWVVTGEDLYFSIDPDERSKYKIPQRASIGGNVLKNIPARHAEFVIIR